MICFSILLALPSPQYNFSDFYWWLLVPDHFLMKQGGYTLFCPAQASFCHSFLFSFHSVSTPGKNYFQPRRAGCVSFHSSCKRPHSFACKHQNSFCLCAHPVFSPWVYVREVIQGWTLGLSVPVLPSLGQWPGAGVCRDWEMGREGMLVVVSGASHVGVIKTPISLWGINDIRNEKIRY